MGLIYIGSRFITAFELYVKAMKERKIERAPETGFDAFTHIASKPRRNNNLVTDIPPEIMAPALKNPPKPAGGFGKKIEE
jgi:hypothetical protein